MYKSFRNWLKFLKTNYSAQKRKIKISKEINSEQVAHLEKQIILKTKWYGSAYGGFYVYPALLNHDSIVYSFGIGTDITFDLKCIKKHHCHVFGFDPTPKSIDWIASRELTDNFHFFDYGISSETGFMNFFLPTRPRGTSGSMILNPIVTADKTISVPMKSFDDITKELGHNHVDLVKMDIEGSEYEVLDSILNSKVTVDQLLIEFHDRFYDINDYRSKAIVNRMKEKGYRIFGHSINYEEISFIKEELIL